MAIADEKPEVDRTSHDVASKKSSSLKEKDAENATTGYLPQSDEEYNVTMKTWCVVMVCRAKMDFGARLTSLVDSLHVLRYQLLDCAFSQRVRWRGRDAIGRPYEGLLVYFAVYCKFN